MFSTVGRDAEVEAAGAGGLFEFADDVAVRAHAGGVPGGHVGVVHGEAVAVLGYGDDVFGSGAGEETDPGAGVESLGFELRDEVFVAELRLGAVGGYVMLEGGVAGDIHVARIPLVGEGGDGVNAPVDEDAELGVAEPVGGLIAGERAPGGLIEGSVRGAAVGGVNFCDLGGDVGGEGGRARGRV